MNKDTEHSDCSHSKWAAGILWLRTLPPEDLKCYPPEVLKEAEECADPQGYLYTWLKLKVSNIDLHLLRGEFFLEHWESLKRAGFTPKQLENAAASGEGFDRIIREAYIEENILPECMDSARKLKRAKSLWRFPTDLFALNDAKRAVEKVANSRSSNPPVGTTEFLPNTEGRVTSINCKWQKLPPAEIAAIEASRDAALERMFTLSPGARDEFAEFDVLRDSYSCPTHLKPYTLGPFKMQILNAVTKADLDFFVRLGEYLKKAKRESKKADAAFIKRFQRQQLALFLIEHWLPSPRLRGTWLNAYLSNPKYFAKAGIHLSPCWLSSGALLITLGKRQAAKRSKTPGLCFLGDKALAEVCHLILGRSFRKSAVNKTIQRLGLKKCPQRELIFTQFQENGGRLVVYGSSPRRAK